MVTRATATRNLKPVFGHLESEYRLQPLYEEVPYPTVHKCGSLEFH